MRFTTECETCDELILNARHHERLAEAAYAGGRATHDKYLLHNRLAREIRGRLINHTRKEHQFRLPLGE